MLQLLFIDMCDVKYNDLPPLPKGSRSIPRCSDYLKSYDPDTYHAMKVKGTLDEHDKAAAENVEKIVDRAFDKAIASPEYLEAQSKADFEKMRRIAETEKMFARHEAEQMYIYTIDDEAKAELDTFRDAVFYWAYTVHFGKAPFDNYQYDAETNTFEVIFDDGIDEYGDEVHPVEEVIAERDEVYDELLYKLLQIDPNKRYKLYGYLECIFERHDPCTDVLKQRVTDEAMTMDEDAPMRRIVQYYLDDDETGLLAYVRYQEREE